MVKIRLKRMGARKRPFYRLVVADARSPRDGRFIEEVGTYDPISQPARVQVDAERVREWMRRGARPSDIARKLLEQEGILPRTARAARPRPVAEAPAAGGVDASEEMAAEETAAAEGGAAADEPAGEPQSETATEAEAGS